MDRAAARGLQEPFLRLLDDQKRLETWGLAKLDFGDRREFHDAVGKTFDRAVASFAGKVAPDTCVELLASLWVPLALRIRSRAARSTGTFVQGVFGIQGTGKSTLCKGLELVLKELGVSARTVSLDDLYLRASEREELRKKDSRFAFRGPPGTHDIALGVTLLEAARAGASELSLPRFDKSLLGGVGDRVAPEKVQVPDVLLFEGWFLGLSPLGDEAFESAPAPIVTSGDREFARDVNHKLKDYLPLWRLLDDYLALIPTDYNQGRVWRHEAEAAMRASGRGGMSQEQIDAFMDYCFKAIHPALFIPALLAGSSPAGFGPPHFLTIEVKPDHMPGAVSQRP